MRRSVVLLACAVLSMAALPPPRAWAVGADSFFDSDDAPDLAAVRAMIQSKDYGGALADLRAMKPSADVYNLMGYSLRKSGDRAQALVYYEKALDIDPAHRQTLEYLGELCVEAGQGGKAHETTDRLRKICPVGCEELSDLDRAIANPPGAAHGQW